MRFSVSKFLLSGLTLGGIASASPVSTSSRGTVSFEKRDGQSLTHFTDPIMKTRMKIVTDSGVCETTPGVGQKSGYISVGANMNMFFWFFEARNKPTTAPLAVWLNGGPGCSSMIGLFQENGPCRFVGNSSTPSLNPYSWNNYANMLYVDQPIGAGFSYGDVSVNGTKAAAPYVWKLLQSFYALYPEYENREFGLFTESYGGHYGPEFVDYFGEQNAAIDAGTIKGEKINLVALGVNNGWIDSYIQYKAYIDFSYKNSYKSLISKTQYDTYMATYTKSCAPLIKKCYQTGSASDCSNAQSTCYGKIEGPIARGDFDVYDIRQPRNDPYPPPTYKTWLSSDEVKKAIGATSDYQECGNDAYDEFSSTGDNTISFLPELSDVITSGVRTLIWAGDADWICNHVGVEAAINTVAFSNAATFQAASLVPYKVNGVEGGLYKTTDNLSYLRVYGAGHEVPYYQPELAYQAFVQTMQGKPISST